MCLILDSAIACSVEERGIDFRIDTPCVAVSFLKLSERKQLAASHRMAEGGDREVKASSILTHTSSAEVVFNGRKIHLPVKSSTIVKICL